MLWEISTCLVAASRFYPSTSGILSKPAHDKISTYMSWRDILFNRTHKPFTFSIQATTTTASDWFRSSDAIVFRVQRSCGHIYSALIGEFLCQRTDKKKGSLGKLRWRSPAGIYSPPLFYRRAWANITPPHISFGQTAQKIRRCTAGCKVSFPTLARSPAAPM